MIQNNHPSHLLFNHYQNLERCAINKCTLALTDEVQRADLGLQFARQTSAPGEYPAYVEFVVDPYWRGCTHADLYRNPKPFLCEKETLLKDVLSAMLSSLPAR